MVNIQYQQRIESTLSMVPVGAVVSYGQLADLAGLPGKARLIAKYLKTSETQINWHRVIRSDGKIAFPENSEQANDQRRRLLSEGVLVTNNRVRMASFQWQPDMYTLLEKLRY
ncbi:MAG TPA: cysteine methyltransferase [Alteromonas australica]|jgi:methylated-DNA-protein-cysteine methyltransferase-like protein|uniref:Cysteine methyltransferase n=1 Tax=Alteromonas australica TaxID=589873 RepID=A0A350P6Y8_9ALTE|nr:MGMT family protein [Alteromonas australica]MAF71916.1 cysteine methyltransferase [Alteromonas sp.]MBU34214.1 cysteine methyltransferase [Alteromonas sp.]HAI73365.1 cysteine methyltransferase [Alteromonas australica]HAU25843.1 cysteine methyltransferase [Alteromonas australica]HAW77055.1 cysteine methyltransferase [Alteromonas australica]|tara:strand:+ start:195 stop:533 length:339 start_codon:yes stop_codon:yes gene_type:complete